MKKFCLLCLLFLTSGCTSGLGSGIGGMTRASSLGSLAMSPTETLANQSHVIDGINVDHYTSAPLQRLKQVRLEAPIETVFAYVGDHERMPDWIPMMHKVTVDHLSSQNGPQTCGTGTIRTCHLGPDKISERIAVWEPNRKFAYRVVDGQKGIPIEGGFGIITFESDMAGHTIMTWRVYYQPKKLNPKAAIMPLMVNYQLNGGLRKLTKRFGGEILVR